jgi:hypothetical protein
MDESKMTPPDAPRDEPGWGERRRRPEPPRRDDEPRPADPPRPDDDARPADEPRPSDEPRPHGDPLFDEPPRDYRDPYGADAPYGRPPPSRPGLDFSALFVLLDALRRAAPADLQDRMTAFIREGLLTLRSLIDWYLDKLERPSREPKVEDIPID